MDAGEILAYVLGNHRGEVKPKDLLEPFGITQFYTDGWGAYELRSLTPITVIF
jgi:insertion element IS1 protein InsB